MNTREVLLDIMCAHQRLELLEFQRRLMIKDFKKNRILKCMITKSSDDILNCKIDLSFDYIKFNKLIGWANKYFEDHILGGENA